MTIKGSLLLSVPIVKRFLVENFSKSRKKRVPKMAVFEKIGVWTLDFIFQTQKGTSLRESASFDVFCVKVSLGTSAVGERMNQKNEIIAEPEELYFTHMGRKKTLSDLDKILHWRRYSGRNHPSNVRIDQLRGFSVARGQILGFSVGCRCRPYNTLALPCECVIIIVILLLLEN